MTPCTLYRFDYTVVATGLGPEVAFAKGRRDPRLKGRVVCVVVREHDNAVLGATAPCGKVPGHDTLKQWAHGLKLALAVAA